MSFRKRWGKFSKMNMKWLRFGCNLLDNNQLREIAEHFYECGQSDGYAKGESDGREAERETWKTTVAKEMSNP